MDLPMSRPHRPGGSSSNGAVVIGATEWLTNNTAAGITTAATNESNHRLEEHDEKLEERRGFGIGVGRGLRWHRSFSFRKKKTKQSLLMVQPSKEIDKNLEVECEDGGGDDVDDDVDDDNDSIDKRRKQHLLLLEKSHSLKDVLLSTREKHGVTSKPGAHFCSKDEYEDALAVKMAVLDLKPPGNLGQKNHKNNHNDMVKPGAQFCLAHDAIVAKMDKLQDTMQAHGSRSLHTSDETVASKASRHRQGPPAAPPASVNNLSSSNECATPGARFHKLSSISSSSSSTLTPGIFDKSNKTTVSNNSPLETSPPPPPPPPSGFYPSVHGEAFKKDLLLDQDTLVMNTDNNYPDETPESYFSSSSRSLLSMKNDNHNDTYMQPANAKEMIANQGVALADPPPSHATQQSSFVEIAPGIMARLRGAQETWEAVENDFYLPVTCFCCSNDWFCIMDATYVLCPLCRVVIPLEGSDNGEDGGVGMGFSLKDLQEMQLQIIQQQQQTCRRREKEEYDYDDDDYNYDNEEYAASSGYNHHPW